MHAFKFVDQFGRPTVEQKRVSEDTLQITPRGELDVSFTNYPDINMEEHTIYYRVTCVFWTFVTAFIISVSLEICQIL